MTNDPFGTPVTLPAFPHPESYRRNIVPGSIPSPTLLTEAIPRSDLDYGDLVLYLDRITTVYRSADGMWIELRSIDNEDVCYLRGTRTAVPLDRIRSITFGSIESDIPVRWIRNDSERYYGKFSAQWEEYCYEQSLDAHETAGNCSEIGWHASLVTIKYRNDRGVIDGATGRPMEYGRDHVLFQWSDDLGLPAGWILDEDDRGMIDVSFFDTLDDLEKAWRDVLDRESAAYADEEEDEDEDVSASGPYSEPGGLLDEIRQAEREIGYE